MTTPSIMTRIEKDDGRTISEVIRDYTEEMTDLTLSNVFEIFGQCLRSEEIPDHNMTWDIIQAARDHSFEDGTIEGFLEAVNKLEAERRANRIRAYDAGKIEDVLLARRLEEAGIKMIEEEDLRRLRDVIGYRSQGSDCGWPTIRQIRAAAEVYAETKTAPAEGQTIEAYTGIEK